MKAPLVGVVGLLVVLSGCVGLEEEGTPADADLPLNTGELKLERILDAEPLEARSLAAPPKWQMGEWWTYRLTDQFTGSSYEFKRIVTGMEGGNYLVGMPADDFMNAIMVLHVPGFGEVKKSDLSFEIHDFPFEPLKFPLEPGAKWPSKFEGPDIEVEVKSVEGTKAQIQIRPTGPGANWMNATYDAELGELSRLEIDGYGTYEVTGHGVGYEGVVTVPHMHDIIFQHVRFFGPFGTGGTPLPLVNLPFQPQMSDTVTVDSTYDRVSFALILGAVPFNGVPDQNSYASLKATLPDGTVYSNEVTAADGNGLKIWYYRQDDPGGDWTFEHVLAGNSITLAEGIAYHVYDVEMPSGRVLPSKGEHKHGG